MTQIKSLTIRGKTVRLPIFLPDATRAVVRSLDVTDLDKCGVEAVVVNTFHLMLSPGAKVLESAGGVGKFMNFDGLIVSDSGGFQIMSLIHKQQIKAKITEAGINFTWRIGGIDRKILFTPEESIRTQFAIKSDIMVALDYFTDPHSTAKEQQRSVDLTLIWAKRAKAEFEKQVRQRNLTAKTRPWLMGVLQGGVNPKLRETCAVELLKINFDLYGYGGWPLDKQGHFDRVTFAHNASLTPNNKPRFALGVGKPEDIILGRRLGYDFFDCVLPTRDARHGRLYWRMNKGKVRTLNLLQGKFTQDFAPIDSTCDCFTCGSYTRGYLHHLFKAKEVLAWRLSSIHNLFFYTNLINDLRNYKL